MVQKPSLPERQIPGVSRFLEIRENSWTGNPIRAMLELFRVFCTFCGGARTQFAGTANNRVISENSGFRGSNWAVATAIISVTTKSVSRNCFERPVLQKSLSVAGYPH